MKIYGCKMRNKVVIFVDSLIVWSPRWWRARRRWSPAAAGVMMWRRVSVISPVVVPVPLIVVSGWPVVPIRLPVPVVPVPVLPPVPVFVVPVPLPVVMVPGIPVSVMVVMIARLLPVPWWTVIISVVFVIAIITSIIVSTWWGRSSVVVSIISIVASSSSVITTPSIFTSPTATAISSSSEAWSSGLAMVEVHPRCGTVSRRSDGKVNSDSESGNFCSVQLFPGLLCVTYGVEINEGETSWSLGRSIQYHVHLLYLPELAKLPLQVLLRGGEI